MNEELREPAKASAWSSIDLGIKILIMAGEDPFYILKVLLQIVRDKKEGEA
tara:strand:- start:347 stop:499 length:153 start_codon:yes stop_codon:yes gene_type:complete